MEFRWGIDVTPRSMLDAGLFLKTENKWMFLWPNNYLANCAHNLWRYTHIYTERVPYRRALACVWQFLYQETPEAVLRVVSPLLTESESFIHVIKKGRYEYCLATSIQASLRQSFTVLSLQLLKRISACKPLPKLSLNLIESDSDGAMILCGACAIGNEQVAKTSATASLMTHHSRISTL